MREQLSRYRERFPTLHDNPPTLRIASPKTHKTGSSTLSSILFRVGARYGKRIYTGGTKWSFLPSKAVSQLQPADEGAYDLEFHHLSANGRWKGKYATARAFYEHILGANPAKITVVRDPPQQLASWVYYYYVPQHRDEVSGGEVVGMGGTK